MQQQIIPVSPETIVRIQAVTGDLRVAGWERQEILAKTDGDRLDLTLHGAEAHVSCDENLILYLPRTTPLFVESVAGDAGFQAFEGALHLGPVAGDVTMSGVGPVQADTIAGDASLRNVAAVTAQSISGDFILRGSKGACSIEHIGGDASLRDINGDLALQHVGSDLYIRNVRGNIQASAGADVVLYLEPLAGCLYHVTAGDDLLVRLPRDVHAELHLRAGERGDVQVDIPGVELSGETNVYDLTIGPQTEDIARLYLTSGDDLLVTCQAQVWESVADFGVEMADSGDLSLPLPPIPPLPPDFSEQINRRVQDAMGRTRFQVEEAARQAEAAGRRAGLKVEAAMRRAEAKARAAEIRARRGQVQMNVGRWQWDLSPRKPVEKTEPVSDEERLVILRMLEQKKISIEEAEKLLAALEGK